MRVRVSVVIAIAIHTGAMLGIDSPIGVAFRVCIGFGVRNVVDIKIQDPQLGSRHSDKVFLDRRCCCLRHFPCHL